MDVWGENHMGMVQKDHWSFGHMDGVFWLPYLAHLRVGFALLKYNRYLILFLSFFLSFSLSFFLYIFLSFFLFFSLSFSL
jgi:hypothetical protein